MKNFLLLGVAALCPFFLYFPIYGGNIIPLNSPSKGVMQYEKFSEKKDLSYTKNEDGSYTFRHSGMGTIFSITLFLSENDSLESVLPIVHSTWKILADWEKKVSFFDAQSELSLLNKTVENKAFKASKELFFTLKLAHKIAQESHGSYDPTMGTLSRLWRRSLSRKTLPDETTIRKAKEKSGYLHIILDESSMEIKKNIPDLLIDLGGIAKGAVIDAMGKQLKQQGIRIFRISSTSDILVGDPPPGKTAWLVKAGSGEKSVFLKNQAISTSGTKNQSITIGGKQYAHLIDFETGLGITSDMEASVIAPTSAEADGYSTALAILKYKGKTNNCTFPKKIIPLEKIEESKNASI